MAVNGGHPDPATSSITTSRPNGAHPSPTPPAWKGAAGNQTDKVVTTNAPGAHTSTNRTAP